MAQKLIDARGRVTGYGYACGYVDQFGASKVSAAHGIITVAHRSESGRIVWVPAPTVKQARTIARALNRGDLLRAVAVSGRPWGVSFRN